MTDYCYRWTVSEFLAYVNPEGLRVHLGIAHALTAKYLFTE